MTGPARVRRNIDTLSTEEVANYEHAIARLREISDADPESIDGYTYFEQLHDGDKGPCEHANDTFMPWHRAHLFLFEEALRRSDPPRTADVTLPYWDWSGLPSGKRYPKAFENPNSILFDSFRNQTPICRGAGNGQCQQLPYPRAYIERQVLTKGTWSATDPQLSSQSFGGFAGGQSNCSSPFGHGFGALEEPAHNHMHGEYVGGDLADPSSAALDPIFFSFHCYIDLLWSQWQEHFTTNTDLEAQLCGLFKDRDHLPENRYRVRDTLNIEEMGYVYEYVPADPPPTMRAVPTDGEPFPTHPALDLVVSGHKEPELVRTLDVTVPEPDFEGAQLVLTNVKAAGHFSYGADIYLTPADEELHPLDRDFRERYLADTLYFWKHLHHHGGHATPELDMSVDLTGVLKSLAAARPHERWRLSVALAASGDSHPQPEMLDFGDLTLNVY